MTSFLPIRLRATPPVAGETHVRAASRFDGSSVGGVLAVAAAVCVCAACDPLPSPVFTLANDSAVHVPAAPVVLDVRGLGISAENCPGALVRSVAADEAGGAASIQETPAKSHPVQCDDLDGDGVADELSALLDAGASSMQAFQLVAGRELPTVAAGTGLGGGTQGFMLVKSEGAFVDGVYRSDDAVEAGDSRTPGYVPFEGGAVPADHVQGSGWPLYEGPVWESDKVAYRLYLDARNRTDVFGKRVPDLVMDTVRGDYHAVSDWGADVLKVGGSLGIGSFAAVTESGLRTVDNWDTRTLEFPVQGPLRSVVRLAWTGWDVEGRELDVTIEYEIMAGQFHTRQRVQVDGPTNGMRFATGVVRHPAAPAATSVFSHGAVGVWTQGPQSDQGDGLMLGAVVADAFAPEVVTTDPLSHVVTFSLNEGRAETLFYARWALEPEPVGDPGAYHARMHALASLRAATQVEADQTAHTRKTSGQDGSRESLAAGTSSIRP